VENETLEYFLVQLESSPWIENEKLSNAILLCFDFLSYFAAIPSFFLSGIVITLERRSHKKSKLSLRIASFLQ